jgi:hypothetical protein
VTRVARAAAVGIVALVAWAAPAPLAGQAASQPPKVVADEFQRGFQSMAWAGLARRIHPEGLAYLRLAVRIVLDADSTGWALDRLLGGLTDRADYEQLDDAEVFRRVMVGVQASVPGLLSSLVSRRSEILGEVRENADTAHVVYRMRALVQGAQPQIAVMTLVRTSAGWRVRSANEIQVLHTAIRGIPIPLGASPSGPARSAVRRGGPRQQLQGAVHIPFNARQAQ